jgi:hypothetical protein
MTAGVLLVDAQGHEIISAKIASTVHDTFHALMLTELDRQGKTTPELFENINLRLAQSVTARNALGLDLNDHSREIATMIYGEICPDGRFRFVNFGSPPPLVFSAEFGCFVPMNTDQLVQFPSSPSSECKRRCKRRGDGSRRMIWASSGSMDRKSCLRVCRAISPMARANSTPVGPAPTIVKVSQARR